MDLIQNIMPSLILPASNCRTSPQSHASSQQQSPNHYHQYHHRPSASRTSTISTPPSSRNSLCPRPSSPTIFSMFTPRRNRSRSNSASSILNTEREDERGEETDAECWERMLALQREYHCYNSARLEAAIEALEMGVKIEEVPIPSRLCLDLLNEGLQAWIEVNREGLVEV